MLSFCLVNYYASGSDSISYHSDDERFLGELPAIASFSLGAKRDFLMKHKPIPPNDNAPLPPETKPIKLPLASGDMILMRGKTQANWLHSIPKRTGKNLDDGENQHHVQKSYGEGWNGKLLQLQCWDRSCVQMGRQRSRDEVMETVVYWK
jgi:hypothetical protein